jgi:uncharacterized protein YqjF (DUF2071 family)
VGDDPGLESPALPLDLFEGQCWVGLTPFYMTHISPGRLPPLPYLSQSEEINVRTYVIVENIPGVYFFSLDASNPLAAWGARMIFHLPYFPACIHIQHEGGSIRYESQRIHSHAPSGAFSATYRPVSAVFQAQRGTLDYWLIERYCLYTVREPHTVSRANRRCWSGLCAVFRNNDKVRLERGSHDRRTRIGRGFAGNADGYVRVMSKRRANGLSV